MSSSVLNCREVLLGTCCMAGPSFIEFHLQKYNRDGDIKIQSAIVIWCY